MHTIRLEVVDDEAQHFVIVFERPGRVEVCVTRGGNVVAHVYEGARDHPEQEPLGGYDGGLDVNRGWTSERWAREGGASHHDDRRV